MINFLKYALKELKKYILNSFTLFIQKYKWRKQNPQNTTIIGHKVGENLFSIEKVKVGRGTYGCLKVIIFNDTDEGLQIGNYCSIANGTTFLLGGDHDYCKLSTYPFRNNFLREREAVSKGPIILDDDVWIGTNCTILSGVHLGKGTVVAAGAVVTKSTKPYSIVGGVPAKLIKKRFEDEVIIKLMQVDYSTLSENKIKNHINLFSENITRDNVDEILNQLK